MHKYELFVPLLFPTNFNRLPCISAWDAWNKYQLLSESVKEKTLIFKRPSPELMLVEMSPSRLAYEAGNERGSKRWLQQGITSADEKVKADVQG